MSGLRILLLAPDCNPDSISTPLIGYEHAEALARLHTVTLVVRAKNEDAVRRAAAPFHAMEAISSSWLDGLYAWALRRIFKYDFGRPRFTPASYPFHLAVELRALRPLRRRVL